MAITNDLSLSLYRLEHAYNSLLSVRASMDELTPAELQLETQWQQALEPVLRDLYWYPLRNGLAGLPIDTTELKRYLRDALTSAAAIAALLALLKRYLIRAVNIGGNMALELLGIDSTFHLANPGYVNQVNDHANTLTQPDTDLSLIDTTVNHLVTGIPQALASDTALMTIGGLITGWAAVRSVRIAITEQTRMIAQSLTWTYGENGVAQQVFTTRADDKVCAICEPLHGRIVPVNNVPEELRIPKHVLCRCMYRPYLTGWQRPLQIWRGG